MMYPNCWIVLEALLANIRIASCAIRVLWVGFGRVLPFLSFIRNLGRVCVRCAGAQLSVKPLCNLVGRGLI